MSGWRNEGGMGDDPNNPYNRANNFSQLSEEEQRQAGIISPQNDPFLAQLRRDSGNPGEKEFDFRYERTRGGPNALDVINPNAPTIDYSQADQYAGQGAWARGQQQGAISSINRGTGLMQQAATGGAPSQAGLQAQLAGNQSLNQLFSAAAMGRGPNRGAMVNQAMTQGSAGMSALGQQAAAARSNEINEARGGVLRGTGYGMERAIGMGQQSAQDESMGLARARYGADLAMRNRELLAQREQAYMGGELGEINRNAMLANAQAAADAQANADSRAAARGVMGAGLSMGGVAVSRMVDGGKGSSDPNTGSSDERGKEARSSGGIDALLAALKHSSSTYEYKDEENQPTSVPKGKHQRFAGTMAQDLERVPEIGHALVTDTPRGKVIENGAALSALLAAVGRQQQQLDALKGGR